MNEEWRPIPGYERQYEVSDHGNIRSMDRRIIRKDGVEYTRAGSDLSQSSRSGYQFVWLSKNGVRTAHAVHRVVAEAFHGSPCGRIACHNDGNPLNNHAGNLRWDTYSGNAYDKAKHGTHHQAVKTHCPRGHAYLEENIIPALSRKGHRACLACNRARGYLKRHPGLRPQFSKIADRYYLAILRTRKANL